MTGVQTCALPISSDDDEEEEDYGSNIEGMDSDESSEALPNKHTRTRIPSPPLTPGSAVGGGKQVSFAGLEIRRYNVIVGDHPCCRDGCPMSLGWDYKQNGPPEGHNSVDRYERKRRRQRRKTRQELRLSWEERRKILAVVGDYSDGQIQRETRKSERDRLRVQRGEYLRAKERELFFCDEHYQLHEIPLGDDQEDGRQNQKVEELANTEEKKEEEGFVEQIST